MTHKVSGLIPAIALAMLVVSAGSAFAGTVSGTVTNVLNGHPIENVAVDLSAAIKVIASTTTNANGYYEFKGVEPGQNYMLTFSCREFVPGTLSPVTSDAPGTDIALNPVGVTKPKKPIAYSGPKSIYMEWFANPEYNLKGYYVWRAATVEAPSPSELAQALAAAVKVSGLIPAGTTEYIDDSVQPSVFYVYQIQALSAADRPSSLSDASENPVKAQFLKLFLPDISVNRDLSGLFLWDLTPGDLNNDKWVRIPVSSECAYEVSTYGIDLKVDLPNDLIVADSSDDIQVMPTGITEGMTPYANIFQDELAPAGTKTLSITSIDSGGRVLYASGEESTGQIRMRAERTGALHETLFLASENDLGTVLGHIDAVEPDLLIVDSVQTLVSDQVEGGAGGPAQVREVASALIRVAKDRGVPVVLVGHVTKDGSWPARGCWSTWSTWCATSRVIARRR